MVSPHRSIPQRIAYVGWSGHGNLGDEAIREAVFGSMTGAPTVVDVPDRLRHMRFIP